jgi:hypothetical protein
MRAHRMMLATGGRHQPQCALNGWSGQASPATAAAGPAPLAPPGGWCGCTGGGWLSGEGAASRRSARSSRVTWW